VEQKIYIGDQFIKCNPGDILALPSPAHFDMVNEPDSNGKYLAFYVLFKESIIERIQYSYPEIIETSEKVKENKLCIKGSNILYSAILHYLEIADNLKIDSELEYLLGYI